MIDYFLAIKILLGTGGGTLNCSGNPASSGTVDDTYQDVPEEAKAADGAAVSETPSNAYADASTDGLICEESFMCKADIFADTLPDTFKIDAEKEAGIDAPPTAYCKDLDPQNDPYSADAVVFLGPEGLVSLYDTCKTNGPNGMLKEETCEGYHGEGTTSSELEPKYIKCNCEEGVCIEESAILCTDPSANVYYPGGSVWTNEDGKTHISVCNGESSVDWYYCNDDGTFHFDTENCDDGVKCGDGMCGGYECMVASGELLFFNPTTGDWTFMNNGCYGSATGDDFIKAYKCPLFTSADIEGLEQMIDETSYDSIPCDEGEECDYGICHKTEKQCEDTEPENDAHILGSVIYSKGSDEPITGFDDCSVIFNKAGGDGKLEPILLLWQGICLNDGNYNGNLTECSEGEICYEGICEPANEENKFVYSCEDTDGGMDPLIAGVVYVVDPKTGGWLASEADSCTSTSKKEITEGYCDGDELYLKTIPCPDDFFCVKEDIWSVPVLCKECKDTDKDNDKAIQGNVIDVNGSSVSDFCNADKKLKQAYCNSDDGTASWSDPEDCPAGTICIEGECK